MKKKFWAAVLCAVMALALLPTAAHAAAPWIEVDGTSYTTDFTDPGGTWKLVFGASEITLTLNGYNGGTIYAGESDLNVIAKGTNTVTGIPTSSNGIVSDGNLRISGGGTLNVTSVVYGTTVASQGVITIQNVTLSAMGGAVGILGGDATISGARVTAIGIDSGFQGGELTVMNASRVYAESPVHVGVLCALSC